MTPPPPFPPPPPLPDSKGCASFRALAHYSWTSILLSMVVNIFLLGTMNPGASRENGQAKAIVSGFLIVTGILSGIIALFGIRRYGRKGLLVPAVIGLCLWLVLFVAAIPAFLMTRGLPGYLQQRKSLTEQFQKTPPTHIPDALRVEDAGLGYSFDLPPGFKPVPDAQRPKQLRALYIRRAADGTSMILVSALPGIVTPYRRMTLHDLPAGTNATLSPFVWRGVTVDGVRMPEKSAQGDLVTFNVQIPIKKQGIQIGFAGLARDETRSYALAVQVLATLDGPVNW